MERRVEEELKTARKDEEKEGGREGKREEGREEREGGRSKRIWISILHLDSDLIIF